jgi:hypothetical protein
MAKYFLLPIFCLSFVAYVGCGAPMSPGVDFNTSQGTDSPPDANEGPEDPSNPDNPGDPGNPGNPGGPGNPGNPDEPGFLPSDLKSLKLWLKSTEHEGKLGDGYAIGQLGVSSLINLAQGDTSHVIHTGVPATYSKNAVSSIPSILICGAKAAGCASSFYDTGAQLQLSNSYQSYSLLKGPEVVTPACATCGGSFTISAVVKRTSTGANMLLANKDASDSVGPYLGWTGEKEILFSTNGRNGNNNVKASISGIPQDFEVVTAVFSRRNGMKVYWQGNLVAFDLLKTTGPSTSSAVVPTLGHKNAPQTQKLHVFEYMEFQSDLLPSDVCDIHSYINESYDLGLSLLCKTM